MTLPRPNPRQTEARDANKLHALAYFLTFRTYGSWLHGDERGSVYRHRNDVTTPRLPESYTWSEQARQLLSNGPVVFDEDQRRVCQEAMLETCRYRGWKLRAINVRTNHVHVVVTANVLPERVMRDLKAYATRGLRSAGLVSNTQRIWAGHGSTRMLYTPDIVQRACIYTIERQGAQLGHAPAES